MCGAQNQQKESASPVWSQCVSEMRQEHVSKAGDKKRTVLVPPWPSLSNELEILVRPDLKTGGRGCRLLLLIASL